jgi:hypothetical protein
MSASPSSDLHRRHAAIALCSAAMILLQITVTRILSVVLWYHWAFFSISLALLGVGAPGVYFALQRPRSQRTLSGLLLGAAVLLPAATVAIVTANHWFGAAKILFCLACLLPPMLCLGAAVCFLLMQAEGPAIGRMYAFDLLGAFAGALVVIPLLWAVPTPMLMGSLALLPLGAYLLLSGSRWTASILMAALLSLLVWRVPFQLRHGKSAADVGGGPRPIVERWTPTARITVFDTIFFTDPRIAFGWGTSFDKLVQPHPPQYWMEQDGSAGTPITQFDGDSRKLAYLLDDVTSVGYQLRRPATAAIIGAGGGRDVLTALTLDVREITAIELNLGIVDLLRNRFGEFSGHLYDHPRVKTVVGEGRSELTRSRQQFDSIQISLIDSWAATSAGAYALSENNLYTVEAYRQYFSRLSGHGLVSTSRWMAGGNGLEVPRLLFVVKAALQAEGIADPLRHIAVVQGGAVGNVLMLRSPLTDAELERLRGIARERGFKLHLPESTLPEAERWADQALKLGPSFYAPQGLRMRPATDDRPFFFQMFSPLRPIRADVAATYGFNAEGVLALQRLMLVMAGVTLLVFFAPFMLGRWLSPGPGFWRGSAYFTGIGCAFMFVEVAWLGRFILYLDHPSLATTVALASMLLGAGIGSMLSMRVGLLRLQRWGFAIPAIVLMINAALGPLFQHTLGFSWTQRLFVSVFLIVPAGIAMGCCFPIGMLRFGERHKAWFWALNGAAGVFSSVFSLALSMEFGFSRVATLGAAIYVPVWLLLRGTSAADARASQPGAAHTTVEAA